MENNTTVSEYKIGHTTYLVKTTFNPAFQESLSDIVNVQERRFIHYGIH